MNNNWTSIHGTILNEILTTLSSVNIEWLVIRNYEGLPWSNCSKDVDICVEKKNWKQAVKITKDVMKHNGFLHYDLKKYSYILCFTFFSNDGKGFKLDFFDRNEYCGLTTHTFEKLNTKKVQTESGVFGSCDLHNAAIVFLRPLLGGGLIKKKYIPEIVTYFEVHPKEFNEEVARISTKRLASKISPYINREMITGVVKLRKKLLWSLFTNNLKQYGLHSLTSIITHYIQTFIVRVRMLRSTPFISVQGSDGVGKTTFIDELISRLEIYYSADVGKVHLYHHRPTLLPNLGAVGEKAKIMKADTNFTDPHRAAPTGFLSSLIRMTYYWIDYLVGATIMRLKDVNSDRITLYDRYIYDFLIDPQRTRIKLPYWIRQIFIKTVIQPRIVFVLLADAKTIYQRKQELTLEEIGHQLGELEKLAKTNKRFIVIDANQTPKKMVDDAMNVILDRFTNNILCEKY